MINKFAKSTEEGPEKDIEGNKIIGKLKEGKKKRRKKKKKINSSKLVMWDFLIECLILQV